jgi:hypothetical protein
MAIQQLLAEAGSDDISHDPVPVDACGVEAPARPTLSPSVRSGRPGRLSLEVLQDRESRVTSRVRSTRL